MNEKANLFKNTVIITSFIFLFFLIVWADVSKDNSIITIGKDASAKSVMQLTSAVIDMNVPEKTYCEIPKKIKSSKLPTDVNCYSSISVLNKSISKISTTESNIKYVFPNEVKSIELQEEKKIYSDINSCVEWEKVICLKYDKLVCVEYSKPVCLKYELTKSETGFVWEKITDLNLNSSTAKNYRLKFVVPVGSRGKFDFGFNLDSKDYVIDPYYISITKAEHLDSDKNFVSDIYPYVMAKDNNWSESIDINEFARITFESELSNKNDITLYARAATTAKIEVYPMDGDKLIATFSAIQDNNRYKVYLNSMTEGEKYSTFDLKILDSPVEFDYIVDPASYCDGTATACSYWNNTRGQTNCENTLGCNWVYSCSGTATACSYFTGGSYEVCSAQVDCTPTGGSCSGTSTFDCTTLTSSGQSTCEAFGCYWDGTCHGYDGDYPDCSLVANHDFCVYEECSGGWTGVTCSGPATDCEDIYNYTDCETQSECTWTYCEGIATACGDILNSTSCGTQDGCTWIYNNSCLGTYISCPASVAKNSPFNITYGATAQSDPAGTNPYTNLSLYRTSPTNNELQCDSFGSTGDDSSTGDYVKSVTETTSGSKTYYSYCAADSSGSSCGSSDSSDSCNVNIANTPDVNVSYPMAGESFNKTIVSTIDINVAISDADTNAFDMNIDLNYSATNTQGTGTPIITDYNVAKMTCDNNNLVTKQQCKYTWTITSVTNGFYYILARVKDNAGLTDYNAGAAIFAIMANATNIDTNIWRVDGWNINNTMPTFSYATDKNLTIDFNVASDTNYGYHYADLNYSTSKNQGTGTSIIDGLKVDSNRCQTNLIGTWNNTPNSDSSLIGYWKFDSQEDVNTIQLFDYSGNGNHGRYYNGADNNAQGKWDNNAGFFDAIDDFVDCGRSGTLDTNVITVSAWVYMTTKGTTSYPNVIAKAYKSATRDYGWKIRTHWNTTTTYHFDLDEEINGVNYNSDLTATGYTINIWHQIAWTYDGTTSTLYVDGTQKASKARSGPLDLNNSATSVYIGRSAGAYYDLAPGGSIDEAKIYNRALTAAEVSLDYNFGSRNFRSCKWDWNTMNVVDTNYYANVLVRDDSGNSDFNSSNNNFEVNGIPPESSCACPGSGWWEIKNSDICTLANICSLTGGGLKITDGSLTILNGAILAVPTTYKLIIEKFANTKLVVETGGKLILNK